MRMVSCSVASTVHSGQQSISTVIKVFTWCLARPAVKINVCWIKMYGITTTRSHTALRNRLWRQFTSKHINIKITLTRVHRHFVIQTHPVFAMDLFKHYRVSNIFYHHVSKSLGAARLGVALSYLVDSRFCEIWCEGVSPVNSGHGLLHSNCGSCTLAPSNFESPELWLCW